MRKYVFLRCFESESKILAARDIQLPGRAGDKMSEKIKATGAKEDKPKNAAKTWVVLASVVSALFAVIGFVMVFIDPEPRYLNGAMYLVSSAAFITAILLISKRKSANPEGGAFDMAVMQGFILQTIGVGPLFSGTWPYVQIAGVAVWAAGLAIMAIGIIRRFAKKK